MFLALLGRESDNEESEDEGRFVPSPLDLSVRVGHGGRDDEIERELSRIRETAEELNSDWRG
jgi:hypothetical protein